MNIRQTFEIYQKQIVDIRLHTPWKKPRVLRQFRKQYKGFSDEEIELLITYLRDDTSKWFVGDLLGVLETFPESLLRPMLTATSDEPDPSYNNEFVKHCRRVFDFTLIHNTLLDLFHSGSKQRKIGVLKAFYWARPLIWIEVQMNNVDGHKVDVLRRGRWVYNWIEDRLIYERWYEQDPEYYDKVIPDVQRFETAKHLVFINEFHVCDDIDLRYHLSLALPNELNQFHDDISEKARQYLVLKARIGVPADVLEFDMVRNIKFALLRKTILSLYRMVKNKKLIRLKHR